MSEKDDQKIIDTLMEETKNKKGVYYDGLKRRRMDEYEILKFGDFERDQDIERDYTRQKKNKKKIRIIIIFCLSIPIILLFLNIYNQKKERDEVSEYLKEKLATEEFLMFKGKWSITEYIDESVEYHGVDTEAEEYKVLNKKYTDEIIDKYLGETLNINEENITYFMAPNEMGFYCADWSDLFMEVRQPVSLGDYLSPPFVYAFFKFKDKSDDMTLILGNNNGAVLDVNGCFFKIEKID